MSAHSSPSLSTSLTLPPLRRGQTSQDHTTVKTYVAHESCAVGGLSKSARPLFFFLSDPHGFSCPASGPPSALTTVGMWTGVPARRAGAGTDRHGAFHGIGAAEVGDSRGGDLGQVDRSWPPRGGCLCTDATRLARDLVDQKSDGNGERVRRPCGDSGRGAMASAGAAAPPVTINDGALSEVAMLNSEVGE